MKCVVPRPGQELGADSQTNGAGVRPLVLQVKRHSLEAHVCCCCKLLNGLHDAWVVEHAGHALKNESVALSEPCCAKYVGQCLATRISDASFVALLRVWLARKSSCEKEGASMEESWMSAHRTTAIVFACRDWQASGLWSTKAAALKPQKEKPRLKPPMPAQSSLTRAGVQAVEPDSTKS